MNFTKHTTGLAAALTLFLSIAALTPSHGAVIITASQVGNDVVFNYSGSIDTSGLTFSGGFSYSSIIPSFGHFGNGSGSNYLVTMIGPAFGTGGLASATSGTGDAFAFDAFAFFDLDASLGVPNSYTSGAALNGSLTFNSTNFTTLGLTSGSYVYQINGSSTNTITMNIDSVPEPSRALLAGLGLCGLLLRRRRVRLV